jgi:HD-like signal output (HDOD) protein
MIHLVSNFAQGIIMIKETENIHSKNLVATIMNDPYLAVEVYIANAIF